MKNKSKGRRNKDYVTKETCNEKYKQIWMKMRFYFMNPVEDNYG
jgi:hypothetical protein